MACAQRRCSGLEVRDVDIGRDWTRVIGKGNKERRVPVDPAVASIAEAYLLAERHETSSAALFVVAKGPNRALAVASDGYGILGWCELDGGSGHALVEAADDLLRWMGPVAEIASSACERGGKLVRV